MRLIAQINYSDIQNKADIYSTYKKMRRFLEIYNYIISEEYKIFSVPNQFIDQLCKSSQQLQVLKQKLYTWQNIKNLYIKNWTFYNIFLSNIKFMLKQNYNCTLRLIKFSTYQDLIQIFLKYPNNNVFNNISKNKTFKSLLYAYTEKYDLILLINQKYVDDYITLNKVIQHQIIHWMQYHLNVQKNTTYGIFDNMRFQLNFQDKIFLLSIVDKDTIFNMLQGLQFQPWVANVCQTFLKYNLNISWYQNTIKNKNLFKKQFKNAINEDIEQILIFGEICYLTSKNNKDDRYWYLIQAIKENEN